MLTLRQQRAQLVFEATVVTAQGNRDTFFGNGGDGAGYANADAVATAIGAPAAGQTAQPLVYLQIWLVLRLLRKR